MAVLGVELIGQHSDVGHGIFNDRREAAVHVSAVIVRTVNGEAVVPGSQTANGSARPSDATRLGGGIGKNDGQFLYVSANRVNRELFGDTSRKSRLDLRRGDLH